jgi:hypothetical protein
VTLGCLALLTIAPAALAQTGRIVGEVSEFGGTKTLIGGILVTAYRENGQVAASATTLPISG